MSPALDRESNHVIQWQADPERRAARPEGGAQVVHRPRAVVVPHAVPPCTSVRGKPQAERVRLTVTCPALRVL
ncbi:hypothetical protein AB0K48_48645, partial [Nonomuraea sp. NPDC055795]